MPSLVGVCVQLRLGGGVQGGPGLGFLRLPPTASLWLQVAPEHQAGGSGGGKAVMESIGQVMLVPPTAPPASEADQVGQDICVAFSWKGRKTPNPGLCQRGRAEGRECPGCFLV